MRLAITGAGGFLGQEIARQALDDPRVSHLRLLDVHPIPGNGSSEIISGDLRDAETQSKLIEGADAVIHLAAILGGAAEADAIAARQVNIDTSVALIEALKGGNTRFVFASSIAVLGADLPEPVTDTTPTAPIMLYGAHKAMIETLLTCEARNGHLDAVSLRPAGIVARDGLGEGLKSAFLFRLFWAIRRGEDVDLPVAPDNRTWMASVTNVARNFLHAALSVGPMPVEPVTLPTMAPRFDELVTALQERFHDSGSCVTYTPESTMQRLFGLFPDIQIDSTLKAGFSCDADLATLIDGAMPETDER